MTVVRSMQVIYPPNANPVQVEIAYSPIDTFVLNHLLNEAWAGTQEDEQT